MPPIASRLVPMPNNYTPATQTSPTAKPPIEQNNSLAPGLTTNLRCALPPIFAATDNLRQYFTGGLVPQYRVFPVQPLSK